MRFGIRECVTVVAMHGALGASSPGSAWAQQAGAPQSISLDSLLSTRISAASKYAQKSAAAPASVTIISSDDLEQFGYRTLQEVLENVRGFYVSNDRNYPYLGARGFSRPSDYNNRILLLVDGHTLNDQTWGGAPIGSDLPLNIDAIERIEIVRGPGSALYGTNAMFAVINIVTKTLTSLDGVIAGARLGSAGLREGSVAAGHALGKDGSFTVSGLISRLDGADLYYPEFDTPQTNAGVARGLDWERSVGGLGALRVGGIVAHVGYRSREKGVPTASYAGIFNDSRTMSADETVWGDLTSSREFDGRLRLTGRLYADRYRYRGTYPTDAAPAYSDGGGSADVGGEGLMVWEATSRHRLTVGSELRRVLRADYYERSADEFTRDDAPANAASVFSQDEFQFSNALTFVGGLRWDWNSRHADALSPRVAVVFTPTGATTIKALYGEAFRAPSAAEADITTTYYTRNPDLQPERIRTLELVVEHRIGAPLLASGSLFHYRIRDLIDQVELSDESVEYRNVARAEGAGAEFELDYRPAGPVSAHASYAFQHADEGPGDHRLTNSPEQIAVFALTARTGRGTRISGLSRYESGRRTVSGPSTGAFIRTDGHLTWSPSALPGAEVGLRVTNLFDVHYEVPGGVEHVQRAITQDGRAYSLRLTWRF